MTIREIGDELPGVHLRSFSTAPPESYSIARWAPQWYRGDRKSLAFMGAVDSQRRPIKDVPPEGFRRLYYEYVRSIQQQVAAWLSSLSPVQPTILCCWCTPKRQRAYPRLFCHRILIGHLIEAYRPDVPVYYEDGAEKPVWTDNIAAGVLDAVTRPLLR